MAQKHKLVGFTAWEVAPETGQRCEPCTPCARFTMDTKCTRVACRAIERADKKEVVFLPDTRKGYLQGVELVLEGTLLGVVP